MMFVCRGGCCTSPPPMDHSLITLSPGEPLLTPSVSKLGLSLPRTLLPPRVCTMFPCVVALLGPPCPACRPGPEQCPQCKRFIQPLPWIRICLLASGNMYTTSQVRMRSMTPCSEHGGPLPHPPQQYLELTPPVFLGNSGDVENPETPSIQPARPGYLGRSIS